MLTVIAQKAKTRNNYLMFAGLFVLFLGLYIFLDFEGNTNYVIMTNNFGLGVVLLHIVINILIATLTSIMIGFSIINYSLNKVEVTGTNAIPFLSFIFGVLTFGCTSCVVAFLAAVGIGFTPLVLPNGNLLWKLGALLFVVLGFTWVMYRINKSTCKAKI